MTPDLGVRACERTLSPPNQDIFTAIPKDTFFLTNIDSDVKISIIGIIRLI